MVILPDTVELNSSAIQSLLDRKHSDAQLSFRRAIQSLKSRATIADESPSCENTVLEASGMTCYSVDLDESDSVVGSAMFGNGTVPSYNKAFQLVSSTGVLDETHLDFSAATLLYNMALTYHRSGLVNDVPAHLEKACSIYKLSTDTLAREQNRGLLARRDVDVLFLAGVNNLASIHSFQHDVCETRHCVDVMKQYVLNFPSDAHDNDEECAFFVRTVVLFELSGVMELAPAA